MKISRLSINDLLKYDTEEYVKENILNTFSSRKNNNVEDFLHNKAIFFEKSSISTTHLIFDNNDTLLGYFSVANKSLILPNERFENLSNSKQKKLMQSGQKVGNGFYLVNSYLLGQLGKNFNLSESEQINLWWYIYLLVYNIIFIIPMFIIMYLVAFGVKDIAELKEMKELNVEKMHLVTWIIMLALWIYVLYDVFKLYF